jgi:hypothetical protein
MQKLLAAVFGILIAAAPAFAQDKPVSVNLGFGATFPTADLKNDFNAGWNGTIGVTYNVTPKVGILTEYMYHRMNGPQKQVLLTPTATAATGSTGFIQSNHQMHTLTFDVVYTPSGGQRDRIFGGYILAGGGYYHRIVQLTSPSVGFTTICDPLWFVCYPTPIALDQILGSRSTNDFGINIGGGITFGRNAKFYVESRYHYVWGPAINPPAGVTPAITTANAAYFPLTFGVRW